MRSRKNSICLLLVACCLCALSGCGYTTQAALLEDVKTIHVEIFKNSIDITKEVSAKDKYEAYRPGLEVDLRDAIVERLFLDGNYKVSSRDSADAILEGEILQYRKDPLRYQDEDVTEYRISIVCDVTMTRVRDSEILIDAEAITGDKTYFTTGTLQETETSALTDAMRDAARRIINRIVENW